MDKRTFIKSVVLGGAGLFVTGISQLKAVAPKGKWDGIYKLPNLPYRFDALEPFIDAETMKLHVTGHHAAHAENLNRLARKSGFFGKPAGKILKEISKYTEDVRYEAGGYFNHNVFFRVIGPPTGSTPSLNLMNAINKDFGSFSIFTKEFNEKSKSVFGSGWVWLVFNTEGKLVISSTHNHDNPLMENATIKGHPILCLDVWEHAYYLKNENQRSEYVANFWQVVNWQQVSKNFDFQVKRLKQDSLI